MDHPVLLCSDTFWQRYGDDVLAIDATIDPVLLTGTEDVSDHDLERITIAYFSNDVFPERSARFMGTCIRAPHLGWLQTFSVGVDHPIFSTFQERGVTVTNAAGTSAPSIAQTVLTYVLALSRSFPDVVRAQARHEWAPFRARDLADLRLAVVGLGAIGTEVARLANTFDMEVIGLRRTVRGDEPCPTWPSERIEELLGWADVVAVTAPLNETTHHLFDREMFTRMRQGAWFINVGRGEVVDEPALVDALQRGWLGAAALDVFETEPLPTDSALWEMPNVILTPHCSGATDRTTRRSVELFFDNLARFTRGDTLLNTVV